MGEQDAGGTGDAIRDQTDKSLRAERDKADASVEEKHRSLEDETDDEVQIGREQADQGLQTARDDADRDSGPASTGADAASASERDHADIVIARERSTADAALEHERAERRRHLTAFLAAEREATDNNLTGERAHADTMIAARDDFSSIISHDLRSMLGGMSLNAQVLVDHAPAGASGDAIRQHAATSLRLVARMDRLVNDLLDASSIETGRLAVFPEQADVSKLVRDTLENFAPLAAANRLTLAADVAPRLLHARLDADRILQVLANLVGNAIKFTPAGGHISIRICREGDEIRFAVSDTGIGIAADALQAVFERFRQENPHRHGLGLGLYIAKSIVEAHGGTMWAESELGAGSTFHFVLPASFAAPNAP